jgi:hypothetical protein
MKNLIALLTIAIVLFSCSKEETLTSSFRLDPEAMISIKADRDAFSSTGLRDQKHLTALEIVRQATALYMMNEELFGNQGANRLFGDYQRDTVSEVPALKMWGTDIIAQDGTLTLDFITSHDVVIQHIDCDITGTIGIDTIAYIPNAVLRVAEDSIRTALKNSDTAAVYRIFNNAFTFRPITQDEWLDLKRQGIE